MSFPFILQKISKSPIYDSKEDTTNVVVSENLNTFEATKAKPAIRK